MENDDLAHARASAQWPLCKLSTLNDQIIAWANHNVQVKLVALPAPAEADMIVAHQMADLPIEFSVEVGAFINTIRSSLDILAMTLVRRYNLTIAPNEVYFPIARTEASFEQKISKNNRLFQLLPEPQKIKMRSLKPYFGGSDFLAALHFLDIERKHRQLLALDWTPGRLSMTVTSDNPPTFIPIRNEVGFIQDAAGFALGMVTRGTKDLEIRLTPRVLVGAPGCVEPQPLIEMIEGFVATAIAAIDKFSIILD